jgi:hypothetical protein
MHHFDAEAGATLFKKKSSPVPIKMFNTRPVVPDSVHFHPICSLHSPWQWYEHQDGWKIQPGFGNF